MQLNLMSVIVIVVADLEATRCNCIQIFQT